MIYSRTKGACEPGAMTADDQFRPARKGLFSKWLVCYENHNTNNKERNLQLDCRIWTQINISLSHTWNAKHSRLLLDKEKNKTLTFALLCNGPTQHLVGLLQTLTFSKWDHDKRSVHKDGVRQVLRNSDWLRLMELYKTDTWSHRQGRVTGRKTEMLCKEKTNNEPLQFTIRKIWESLVNWQNKKHSICPYKFVEQTAVKYWMTEAFIFILIVFLNGWVRKVHNNCKANA